MISRLISCLISAGILNLVVLTAPAQAGESGATISVGESWFPGRAWVIDPGRAVRAGVLRSVGGWQVGPVLSTAVHNACPYSAQIEGTCDDVASGAYLPGDFYLVGLGATAGKPDLVQAGAFRLGGHADLGAERFHAPMDTKYYKQDVLQDQWGGQEPDLGLREVLIQAALEADVAWALSSEDNAPELVLSLGGAYHTKLGPAATAMLGIRVRPGG